MEDEQKNVITFEGNGQKTTIEMDQDAYPSEMLNACISGIMLLGYEHNSIIEAMNEYVDLYKVK